MTTNFELDTNDLLFYKEQQGGNDIIMSGGYSVDSYLLKAGLSPIQTFNSLEGNQEGGSKQVSSIFENLAVPAGLFFNNQKPVYDMNGGSKKCMDHQMLPDNIFDEFMRMIEIDKNKKRNRKSRRPASVPNKKTRRLTKT
jgi:hypothetical protein